MIRIFFCLLWTANFMIGIETWFLLLPLLHRMLLEGTCKFEFEQTITIAAYATVFSVISYTFGNIRALG